MYVYTYMRPIPETHFFLVCLKVSTTVIQFLSLKVEDIFLFPFKFVLLN